MDNSWGKMKIEYLDNPKKTLPVEVMILAYQDRDKPI